MEKIIHNIWIGPYELPDMPKYFIERSKELNKTFEHKLWTDNNLPTLPDKINKLMSFHYNNGRYALSADILRICLVYMYGGFYIDIDTRPNGSMDNLNLEKYNAILPYHNEYTFANTFFGCAKNSGYIVHLYELLLNAKVGDDFFPCWFNSGVKNFFNIKEIHDYSSEECQIVGKQMLKVFDENKILYLPINGEFKNYYEHFAMYSWSDHNKKHLDDGNINYIDTVYKINYKIE